MSNLRRYVKLILRNAAIKWGILFHNSPKKLDLSYKTDLAFWDCFGRFNQHLVAKRYAIRYKAKSIITGMHPVSGLNVCGNRKNNMYVLGATDKTEKDILWTCIRTSFLSKF